MATRCPQCGGPLTDAGAPCPRCVTLAPGAGAGPGPGLPGPVDPLIGRLVAERFRIEALVGAGGMGRVYRAIQSGLERPVALKVLHPTLARDPDQKRRFHREARAASRLSHPNTVAVYDFGEFEGQLYIAMEFLSGRSLAAVLEEDFPLPASRVVDLLAQVADALGAAHQSGMLHRDLKPENVIVVTAAGGAEIAKVVDFGLAILTGPQADERVTSDSLVSGTPGYMAPEQCLGRTLSPQSDLYSLAVILYQMLCGALPFTARTPAEVLLQHVYAEPPAPSQQNPGVAISTPLEALALRGLAKDPGRRPPSAEAFREALFEALDLGPGVSRAAAAAERKRFVLDQERRIRAELVGIPEAQGPTLRERPYRPGEAVVRVVEPPGPFADSLAAFLRVHQFTVEPAETLAAAAGADPQGPVPLAVVVDLGASPRETLAALAEHLVAGRLGGAPVVAVGPDDALEPMARALELGVGDYVPAGERTARLPRTLERLRRRRARLAAPAVPAPAARPAAEPPRGGGPTPPKPGGRRLAPAAALPPTRQARPAAGPTEPALRPPVEDDAADAE